MVGGSIGSQFTACFLTKNSAVNPRPGTGEGAEGGPDWRVGPWLDPP
jgi:hypothetical protein